MLRTNPGFSAYIERLSGKGIGLREYSPGDALLRQDTPVQQVFIIHEGITKCFRREDNTKDIIFEFLGRGEITGELEVIRNAPCICTIEAITPVSAWVIPKDIFTDLLRNDPDLGHLVMTELATRLADTCVRASYQQLYPLEYGLLRFLMVQEEQQLYFSRQDMADYLAITVRSFNRTVKQLREKKVIAVDGLHLDLTRKELEVLLKRFED